jgi:hypothetical protein
MVRCTADAPIYAEPKVDAVPVGTCPGGAVAAECVVFGQNRVWMRITVPETGLQGYAELKDVFPLGPIKLTPCPPDQPAPPAPEAHAKASFG